MVAFGAALVAGLLLLGCGGDDDTDELADTAESAGTMRLTLTDEGCTYLGDDSLESGSFTVEVENQTEFFGAFAVAGLAEGSTVGDLETFVRQAQEEWDESGTLPELPAFYSQAVRTGVEAEPPAPCRPTSPRARTCSCASSTICPPGGPTSRSSST